VESRLSRWNNVFGNTSATRGVFAVCESKSARENASSEGYGELAFAVLKQAGVEFVGKMSRSANRAGEFLMIDAEGSARNRAKTKSAVPYVAVGVPVIIILVTGPIIVASPKPAAATPAHAAQTKLACGRCHVKPAGGEPLTDFGKAFAANGHKLPKQ
jgi:hypothetical protein